MKDFLKFFGGSLFSNTNVIKGKNRKFYQSFIVVVLSLLIAIIPILVYTSRASGADIITKADNSSLDVSLNMFSEYLATNEDGASFVTTSDGLFKATGFTEKEFTVGEKHLLTVRVVGENDNENDLIEYYRLGTDLNGKPTETPKSFMLIFERKINIYTFSRNASNTLREDGSVKKKASFTTSFVGYSKSFKNQNFASFYHDELGGDQDCFDQWKNALNKMYQPYKTSNLIYSMTLYTVLNVVIILTMALITMILTRLKSSQCEKMNYKQALNCINFSAFTPAVIGMLLGFLLSNIASIGFILCMGIRSIFLGFKASQSKKY